jgi:hypothetical protein
MVDEAPVIELTDEELAALPYASKFTLPNDAPRCWQSAKMGHFFSGENWPGKKSFRVA